MHNNLSFYDQVVDCLFHQGYRLIKRKKDKKPEFYRCLNKKVTKISEPELKADLRELLTKLLNKDNLSTNPDVEITIEGYSFTLDKGILKTASKQNFALTRELKEALAVLKSSSRIIAQENQYALQGIILPVENGVITFSSTGVSFIPDNGKTYFFKCISAGFEKNYLQQNLPELFTQIIWNGLYNYNLSELVNKERFECFLDLLAYSFIPGNPCKKLFFIFGATQAGKTVLMEIIKTIFGDFGTSISATSIITHSRSNPELRPDLFELDEMLWIDVSETEKSKKLDSRLLKTISGGDTVSVRTLHSSVSTNSKITGNFWIVSNFYPVLKNQDDQALYERFVVIDWHNTVPPEKRIQNIVEQLTTPEMRSRIFSCLLARAARLYQNGAVRLNIHPTFFYHPPREPMNIRMLKNCTFEEFCQQCLYYETTESCRKLYPGQVFYQAYYNFCCTKQYPAESILSNIQFLMKLGPYVKNLHENVGHHIDRVRHKNGNFYRGIFVRNVLLPYYSYNAFPNGQPQPAISSEDQLPPDLDEVIAAMGK